jgi:holo-[acyl-carrier protein] synthase
VDLVEVRRVRAMMQRHGQRARRRLFTEAELADCDRRSDPAECQAARLAAKEAVFKALGTGKSPGFRWTDVEIVSEPSGSPRLELRRQALGQAEELGVTRALVSLSHDAGLGCAVVVLEAP